VICNNCGTSVSENQRVCHNCGHILLETKQAIALALEEEKEEEFELANLKNEIPQHKKVSEVIYCPKCHSTNTSTETINKTTQSYKKHSIFYWLFFGWWWNLWLSSIFGVLYFVHLITKKERLHVNEVEIKMACCKDCGHIWEKGRGISIS